MPKYGSIASDISRQERDISSTGTHINLLANAKLYFKEKGDSLRVEYNF